MSEFRPWDELIPEAFELIFRTLSVQDKLTVIPSVCKSWGRVEIEIEGWKYYSKPETLSLLLQMIFPRCSGKLSSLSIIGLADDKSFLSLIAD
ncbi:hypothetical protein TorRG33x02_338850 [Trema orientale]|uniref:F-box domain containing protein n=1 Tax=Trema orientale TaxID=63057 RepID=A0A2P5AX20_TREOI|nr:hypothetical protein TorRG33x02_338850 [Trema orientale]